MENYIVSARKYRPSTFKSVVGQRALTITLKNAIETGKLAHAYLFCGPRGVGKTSCARIFAKTINCLHPTADGEACNECESCRAFNEQRSMNIHELDAASNNSVDDIRQLIDQVRIPPVVGRYKVFIIDEVHMLSAAAFNAFLKTLEEPPHHAIFVLATTEKHKVLPTILSRCQIYDFSRISIRDIVEHLAYVARSEGATADPEALSVIAQKADGGMRDALSIFDQIVSFTGGQVTYQSVIDNLNVLDYEYYFRLTNAMLEGNIRGCLLLLNDILSKGFDGQNIVTGLASHFRDLLVCKDPSTIVLFEVGDSIRERYKETATKCTDEWLFKAIELANRCDLDYRQSRNKRLLIELTLIQICQLTKRADQGIDNSGKKKAVIEPLANTQTPVVPQQQAPTLQSAPSMRAAAPSGQPREIPSRPSATSLPSSSINPTGNTQGNTATTQIRTNRPPQTALRLIGNKQQNMQQDTTEQQISSVEEQQPLTEQALISSWKSYTERISKDVYVKNTMLNCLPQLSKEKETEFEVVVHNPGQQDQLAQHSYEILTYLRKQLKNSLIQMNVRIEETNTKQLAYTAEEKYKQMRSLNPQIGRLVEIFQLRLD